MKKLKGFSFFLAWLVIVLAGVGGLVHVGLSFNLFDILSWFPSTFASWTQFLAGLSGAVLAIWFAMRMK